jgi:hypothetical protein
LVGLITLLVIAVAGILLLRVATMSRMDRGPVDREKAQPLVNPSSYPDSRSPR